MDFKDKKVLVTGAAGFIGSHLCEALVRRGASVKAFVHYNSFGSCGWLDSSEYKSAMEIVTGDVCDFDTIRAAMKGTEVVFHLAALIGIPYSYQATTSYVRTVVEGSTNVFRAGLETKAQLIVHTSTSEVYGTAQYVPMDEKHPLNAQSPYAATKVAADQMALSFYHSFGLPIKIARPFNTYGPRQSARAIIPTIITQALAGGEEFVLGNITPTRDFTFVEDCAEGFIAFAATKELVGEVAHIGSNVEVSVAELVAHVAEIVGCTMKVVTDAKRTRPEDSEVNRLFCSNSKLVQATGWQPRWSLSEGLKKTIEWFEGNLNHYRANEYYV